MPRKNENEPYTRITSEEANKILENKEGVVIDVRGEDEYIKGHVKGATLIPVDQIMKKSAFNKFRLEKFFFVIKKKKDLIKRELYKYLKGEEENYLSLINLVNIFI